MTTTMTAYDDRPAATTRRRQLLTRLIAGAAVFDGALGVFCLVAASDLAGWLSIPKSAVIGTAVVFFVAALEGAITAARGAGDVRWIAGANIVFAIWCVGVAAFDSPNALGWVLLLGAAATALETAIVELRLARRS